MKNDYLEYAKTLFLPLSLSFFIFGCSEPTLKEVVLRPVKTMIVVEGNQTRERLFSGSARSAGETEFSFKVSGSVSNMNAKVGDRLEIGHVFASLDPESYRLQLEQARADTNNSNARRRSAEAEYQRVRQLYANDNSSTNELDNSLAEAESARASYEAAVQAEKLAALDLEYTRLRSPQDCTIADIVVEENENVSANQRVATANCGGGWEVTIDVAESVIGDFKNGQKGKVRFHSVPDSVFEGTVTEIGVGTNDRSTFPITLSLSTTPTSIRTNLAAEATFKFAVNNSSNSIYVPPTAVSQDHKGTYTFVVIESENNKNWMLQKRYIEIGELRADGLQVFNGLKSGERILSVGHVNARNGMIVRAAI